MTALTVGPTHGLKLGLKLGPTIGPGVERIMIMVKCGTLRGISEKDVDSKNNT
jgi:hypothetical protein